MTPLFAKTLFKKKGRTENTEGHREKYFQTFSVFSVGKRGAPRTPRITEEIFPKMGECGKLGNLKLAQFCEFY